MGWNCRQEHSKALDRLTRMGAFSGEHGYFCEGPRNHRDYTGTISLPAFRLERTEGSDSGLAYRIGYVRISPRGRISMPRSMAKAINLA